MSRPKQGKGKLCLTREDIYSRGMTPCPICGVEYPTFRVALMLQKASEQKRNLAYYKGDFCPLCRAK